MRRNAVFACVFLACLAQAALSRAAEITGAGATFPYPVYARWAEAYQKATGAELLYQAIGSGGGIRRIKAGAVTFGASDIPLAPEELDAAGLMQFPMVLGGVVPVLGHAIAAAGKITLNGPVLADVFMGKITRWDDPRIKALNPTRTLPALDITPVHRADRSGTNFLFASYLSREGAEFGQRLDDDSVLKWPAGFGAKGNEGVAEAIEETGGAIGYVEFAYARTHALAHVTLINSAGQSVEPGKAGLQSAAANVDWARAKDFDLTLIDAAGPESWPISGVSFILIPKVPPDGAATGAALAFFDWAYRNGGSIAAQFDYVAIPEPVENLIRTAWHNKIRPHGTPIWPP